MATVTVVNDDRPNFGWIIAFFLLCYIFLQRECNSRASDGAGSQLKTGQIGQLTIANFQENAVRFNGERVKIGPCWTFQCKPNDSKAWITDEFKSDYVLAISNTGFPYKDAAFYVEGVPTLKRINNKQVWLLTDVKVTII